MPSNSPAGSEALNPANFQAEPTSYSENYWVPIYDEEGHIIGMTDVTFTHDLDGIEIESYDPRVEAHYPDIEYFITDTLQAKW